MKLIKELQGVLAPYGCLSNMSLVTKVGGDSGKGISPEVPGPSDEACSELLQGLGPESKRSQ